MENRIKFSGRYRFLGLLGVYFVCLAIYLLVCLLALGEMGGAFFVGVATLPIWSKGWRILDPILGVETARWEQWVSLLALAAFVGWQWGSQVFPWVGVIHLACGWLFLRVLSDRVIWWNQADSLQNIYRDKLGMLWNWPWAAPRVIWKMVIARIL